MENKGIVTPLITIGLTADKKLTITGPLEDKTECCLILADALKMVATYRPPEKEAPAIVTPNQDKKIAVIRGIK